MCRYVSDLFPSKTSTNHALRLVYTGVTENNSQVLKDLLAIVGEPSTSSWLPESPQEIASRLMHTA